MRESLYQGRTFRTWRPPAPCVSVGNIGWGGTGKTPLVSWLLSWAAQQNIQPAVLTRGYGARPQELPYLVPADGVAEEAGDEPLMLARLHPEAAIVVDPVRMRGGQWVAGNQSPQLYILDDGFQHMAVQRDIDLVLMKPEDFTCEWNRVIPSGSWREGWRALERGDCFLVKVSPDAFQKMAAIIQQRMDVFERPVFSFYMQPQGLQRIVDGTFRPDLGNEPYLLASGVGDGGQVETTASRFFGRGPELHCEYADHHAYCRADVAELEQQATELGCEHIVCTPKDAVKLAPLASNRFWTLEMGLAFGPALGAAESFPQWWADRYTAVSCQ